jgi:hypothetical protein
MKAPVVFLVAMAVLAQPQPATRMITFAVVGVAANQTARLNVLNPGGSTPGGAVRCIAELMFMNSEGEIETSKTFEVPENKAVFLDFPPMLAGAERLQLRAALKITASLSELPEPGIPISACNLLPSLEVFDTRTGKTRVVLVEGRMVSFPAPAASANRRIR